MATVSFSSDPSGEVIQVEFIPLTGATRVLQLLVDSGFTGISDMVLSINDHDLTWGTIRPVSAHGALHGDQQRAHVVCRVDGLAFEHRLAAIITDLSQLRLPPGVGGMVGLTFLRRFARWGAECKASGQWQFFLTDNDTNA